MTPNPGDVIALAEGEDEPVIRMEVIRRRGAAQLLEIVPADAPIGSRWSTGVIALQPNGDWWWIAEPRELEPWESLG